MKKDSSDHVNDWLTTIVGIALLPQAWVGLAAGIIFSWMAYAYIVDIFS